MLPNVDSNLVITEATKSSAV